MAPIRTSLVGSLNLMGQLGLSVTATIAATLIVSGLQSEVAGFRPMRPAPQLTSGGKFAARIEAIRAEPETTVPVVPRMPLLAADVALRALPIDLIPREGSADAKPAVEPVRPAKRVARAEIRRRNGSDGMAGILPPRRSDNIVTADHNASPVDDAIDVQGVWTATKGVYRQAVWFGGSVLDRINPLNLLP